MGSTRLAETAVWGVPSFSDSSVGSAFLRSDGGVPPPHRGFREVGDTSRSPQFLLVETLEN